MIKTPSAAEIVTRLSLKPHPEGGYFVETFRSAMQLTLPDGRVRSAGTAIYFLLTAGTFSALHRVASDETWHFYAGDPLELSTITAEGTLKTITLGRDLESRHVLQYVVPAGIWQGASPINDGASKNEEYTLVGCTVSPGFDFADFEMPNRAELLRLFPEHTATIRKLTRS
jgi:predicted cupin superfamily sugar epimerase